MRIPNSARFAITAIIDLAQHANQPLSITHIAALHGVSPAYLEQIFLKLRKFGLVRGIKGPGGGFMLAKTCEEITLADILRSVGDVPYTMHCMGESNCNNGAECSKHKLWAMIDERINHVFESVNIATLLHTPPTTMEHTTL